MGNRFIGNLQPANSNVKLLQRYGIFLTSFNLTCIKVKNTVQLCDDPAHQRPSQETLHPLRAILASPPLMLKHKIVVYFPLPQKWSIIVYLEWLLATKRCIFCVNEKLSIVSHKQNNILNKKTEIVRKCRHINKYKLLNHDTKH